MRIWMILGLMAWLGLPATSWALPVRTPRVPSQEVQIPKSVDRIKEYEKAKTEAKKKKKHLVLVISEEGVKRPGLDQATTYALQRGHALGVLVYVDIKEIQKLPEGLSSAANGFRDAFPGIIIVNPESEEVLTTIPHKKDQMEWEKDIRDAKQKLSGETPATKEKGGKN